MIDCRYAQVHRDHFLLPGETRISIGVRGQKSQSARYDSLSRCFTTLTAGNKLMSGLGVPRGRHIAS